MGGFNGQLQGNKVHALVLLKIVAIRQLAIGFIFKGTLVEI